VTSAPAPGWFTWAVDQEPREQVLDVSGARIRLRQWGSPADPGIVLVHGGAAHSGWWDHVAPYLAREHHVVALDLSGHGDSDHRPSYSLETWQQEVGAASDVAAAGGAAPVIVGHSMGGRIAVILAARQPAKVAQLVLVDAPLAPRAHKEELLTRRRRPTRIYPSADEAVQRWASLPPQHGTLPFIRERVARDSVRAVAGGWTWKFDPAMFGNASDLGDAPERVRCSMVLLRCEFGILSSARVAEAQLRLGDHLTVLELPAAGHHPMLDQPLLLVGVLRSVIALGGRQPLPVA